MSIFDTIYSFFYNWLFGNASSYLSTSDCHFACVLLSVIVLVWVLSLAILPIKAVVQAIFRGL